MISQCRICEHCAIDDISEYCEKNLEHINDYSSCPSFERIKSISEYCETDTVCDKCTNSYKCSLISVMNIFDKRPHYSDVEGNNCEIDNNIRNYWEWFGEDISGEDEE